MITACHISVYILWYRMAQSTIVGVAELCEEIIVKSRQLFKRLSV